MIHESIEPTAVYIVASQLIATEWHEYHNGIVHWLRKSHGTDTIWECKLCVQNPCITMLCIHGKWLFALPYVVCMPHTLMAIMCGEKQFMPHTETLLRMTCSHQSQMGSHCERLYRNMGQLARMRCQEVSCWNKRISKPRNKTWRTHLFYRNASKG